MWWKISKELQSDKTSEFGSKVMHSHRTAIEESRRLKIDMTSFHLNLMDSSNSSITIQQYSSH